MNKNDKSLYTSINPGNVVWSKIYDREDVTNTMFWWTDNIYSKPWFGKPKLIIKEGFVYKDVAPSINDLKFLNSLGCRNHVYLLNNLRDGKHDLWPEFEVEYADIYQESKIFIKPYVAVKFVNGEISRFFFDKFEDAERFNKNIFNHPTSYHRG